MEKFMRTALEEAQKAFDKDEIPVGTVVVCDGKILSQTHNLRQSVNDPTAHAEILAIKEAARKRGDWRLNGCEIYVTKEPCPMCAGAIQQARFDKLIYGCKDKKAGYAGSLYNVLNDRNLPHQVEVISGIDKDNCKTLLQEFFRKKRNNMANGSYFVYILKSLNSNRYYIGSTRDMEKRLKRHNSGVVKATKTFKPWVLVYKEKLNSREKAYKRERQIKSYKSGNAFKKLIDLK